MEQSQEERQYPRHKTPLAEDGSSALTLYIPDLSDGPLTPLDFSTGGFLVTLATPPETPRPHVICFIGLLDIALTEFKAEIVRSSKNEGDPPTWTVGLTVEMEDHTRDYFASLLTAMLTGTSPDYLAT